MSGIVFDQATRLALSDLRRLASDQPVDISTLTARLRIPDERRKHRAQMQAQALAIEGEVTLLIVYSVETGHPAGSCRHMSISVDRPRMMPSQAVTERVMAEFGFLGGAAACSVWTEKMGDGQTAVHVVQPLIGIHEATSRVPS